jgi:energy-coupling factor transporter ATP-binding protein EcfA2
VPPHSSFEKLMSRDHTLVVGPRGSGKTTLLKMLTLRALSKWSHPQAESYFEKIQFNSAFIPADIAWGKQLDALAEIDSAPYRKEAAYVVHTIRALIRAMREAMECGREPLNRHLRHLVVDMPPEKEEQFVIMVAPSLGLKPPLNSLLGLELALEMRLDEIYRGDDNHVFQIDSFPSKLSLLIAAFNGLTKRDERRWALLFDELEIAPTKIKSFLLSSIRSFDERIVIKLALAPYLDDAGFDNRPVAPNVLHDYHTVQLTYSNKEDAARFSAELFAATFERLGMRGRPLSAFFQDRSYITGFGRKANPRFRNRIPKEFLSLAEKDDSFKRYADEKGFFETSYRFTENAIAQDIRKVLPIVIARDYYIRRFEHGRLVVNRSRKAHSLYASYPSIVEITEGNPRAILTLVGPMVQEHLRLTRNEGIPIEVSLQTQAIRRVELLLTSLLQVIPIDMDGVEARKGLLGFIDQIGRCFEARLLRKPFVTDYVGSFVMDEKVPAQVMSAVGKALNAGALVHAPYEDSGDDALLRGLQGQRFRLSYSLASRFRLLLTLGDRIRLSRLLVEAKGAERLSEQRSLFDANEPSND